MAGTAPGRPAWMPVSVVVLLVLDALLALLLALHSGLAFRDWEVFSPGERSVFIGEAAVALALSAAMAGLLLRQRWSRLLNVAALWAPVGFLLVAAFAATASLLGFGEPDPTAGLGVFFAVWAMLVLAPFVAVGTIVLCVLPGARSWLAAARTRRGTAT